MKLIRITIMELKKSLHSDTVLSMVLLLGIVISYSVLIYYNDTFYNQKRLYLSSQLQLHSVDISLNEIANYNEIEKIFEILDNDICDYYLLGTETDTSDKTYDINSCWTLFYNTKNPYDYLYSTTNQRKFVSEPETGTAYMSNIFTVGRQGEGLYFGGSFNISGNEFILSDFFVPTAKIEVIISNEDFAKLNTFDRITYVYQENALLGDIEKINKQIFELFPQAKVNINNTLDDRSVESYRESMLIFSILIVACIVNYCLIFVYLAGKRMQDYMVMRLFGLHKSQITIMLLLEFGFYNIVTIVISMLGFAVFWSIQGATDIYCHLITAYPVMILFCTGSALIGISYIVKFSSKMPVSYRER